MCLHLTPNVLYFLPDLSALYALRRAPNLYEIHPVTFEEIVPNLRCLEISTGCKKYFEYVCFKNS
jgi:hypothetical protein